MFKSDGQRPINLLPYPQSPPALKPTTMLQAQRGQLPLVVIIDRQRALLGRGASLRLSVDQTPRVEADRSVVGCLQGRSLLRIPGKLEPA